MNLKQSFASVLNAIAQGTACAAIVFAFVARGAADHSTQLVVSWMLLVALLASLRWRARTFGNLRWVVPLLAVWFAWLLVLRGQALTVPAAVISRLAPFTNLIRSKFVGDDVPLPSTLALIPSQVESEWPLHVIGWGFLVLGAVQFSGRKYRRWLWGFFAAAGIMLPLVVTLGQGSSTGDATGHRWNGHLLQDNSLAALLVLALACLLACLLEALRPAVREQIKRVARLKQIPVRSSRHSVRAGIEQLNRQSPWMTLRSILFLVATAYLLAAVAWFGSSMWLAITLAVLLVWGLLCYRLVPQVDRFLMAVTVAVLLSAVAVHVTSLITAADDPNMLTASEQFNHWSDAIDAALSSPRIGTGLGSYAFTHLLHLDRDTRFWIQDPHSLLLKWAVEAGVIGVTILLVAVALWTLLVRRLYLRRLTNTIFPGSLTVSLIAGLTLLLGSIMDSVMLTPAVLWSYALVLGSVATTVRERTPPRIRAVVHSTGDSPGQAPEELFEALVPWWLRTVGNPLPWTALAIMMLLAAQPLLEQTIDDQTYLATVPLPRPDFAPEPTESEQVINELQQRIERGGRHPDYYRLLGIWTLAEYRRDLVARVSPASERLPWSKSAPAAAFVALQRLTEPQQAAQIELWRGSAAEQQRLQQVMQWFEMSLARNPLQPQIHLWDAELAPLTGRNGRRAIINAKRIAGGDPDTRFALGKIGWSIDDVTLMTEQWRRLMSIPSEYTFEILRMSRVKISPQMLVDEIIADAGPERWQEIIGLVEEHPVLSPLRPAIVEAASWQ